MYFNRRGGHRPPAASFDVTRGGRPGAPPKRSVSRLFARGLLLRAACLLLKNLEHFALVVRREAVEAARDLVLLVDPLANLRGVVAQLARGLQNLLVQLW